MVLPSSGSLGVNLQSPGPMQPFLSGVQCSGDETELFTCQNSGNELSCESTSAAGIACQGIYKAIYEIYF